MAVTLIKILSDADDENRSGGKKRVLYGCEAADVGDLPTTDADFSIAYVNGGTNKVLIGGAWEDV